MRVMNSNLIHTSLQIQSGYSQKLDSMRRGFFSLIGDYNPSELNDGATG